MDVVNKLIKYAHFISFKKIYDTKQFKYFYINKVIQYQRILKNIINEKNKLFTSKYWQTLMQGINIKLKFSTTYHLPTDGQIK